MSYWQENVVSPSRRLLMACFTEHLAFVRHCEASLRLKL